MRWAVFLRGVNVGGHGRLPMEDLRTLLQHAGLAEVATWIQSGNIVCTSEVDPGPLIAGAIEDHFGFRPPLCSLQADRLRQMLAEAPFRAASSNTVHGWLHDAGRLLPEELPPLAAGDEAIGAGIGVLWLHAPSGIGRSRLASRIDRALPPPVTARSRATLERIAAML